jgi:hypothetical protein
MELDNMVTLKQSLIVMGIFIAYCSPMIICLSAYILKCG